jgi:peptidoglycan/LPS O-acetylase OafA/YrhL
MNFRKDINGLRAIAVIAVVLFHFNPSWLPGGFAGVDVFFVISGFLMTGIIFRGIQQNSFSILNFYVARANRIIPALALLCLTLLALGWFFLMPSIYKDLGKHISSSMSFTSNLIYWSEAGYFDAASHEKWLLHTWSLSVEWQFYIIYPLVLLLLRRFISLEKMKLVIAITTGIFFIFCVFITNIKPDFSYYSLPTRAWEMMLGGVAFLYPFSLSNTKKRLLEGIGLLLIFGSYFFISADNLWPGYLALFPVLGTFFIIQAQRQNSVITNNFVFQKLGLWSYSIYLWHWPLVVIIYIFSLSGYVIYPAIILSVLLGFLSNRYIETIKFKKHTSSIVSLLKCKPLYLALITIIMSSYVWLTNGDNYWLNFQSENVKKTYSIINAGTKTADWKPVNSNIDNLLSCRFKVREFDIETKERLKECHSKYGAGILVLGDSHAIDLFWLIYSRFDDPFVFGIPVGGCRPHTPENGCFYNDLLDFAAKNNVFKHGIFEQSGSYLLLDKNGNKGSRNMFSNLSLTDEVQGLSIDTDHINKVKSYLQSLSQYVDITWFGSRIEPHISNQQILKHGCDFNFKLRKNQNVIFEQLDAYIRNNLPLSSALKFVSQNDAVNFTFPSDFMDCNNIYWTDGDHLSDAGEKRFGERLPEDFLKSW